MFLVVVLLLLGLILIALEAALPYGVSAIIGLLMLALSIYYSFLIWGPAHGMLVLILVIPAVTGVLWLAIRHGKSAMALKPAEDEPPPEVDPERPPLGQVLEVVQPLRPTGSVRWQGRLLAARSLRQELRLDAGREVVVRGHDSIYVLVEPADPPSRTAAGRLSR